MPDGLVVGKPEEATPVDLSARGKQWKLPELEGDAGLKPGRARGGIGDG